jgi:hypothetical protein
VRIIHRVTLTVTKPLQKQLALLGFDLPLGLTSFDVEQAHPSWSRLAEIVREEEGVDIPDTMPTERELFQAAWLRMLPDWHWSYPQPEEGYLQNVDDLRDYCTHCGVGRQQRGAFRVKGEPKWDKRSLLQLNWVFDEFFVRRDVCDAVFGSLGLQYLPVIDHKSGTPLDTIVQLDLRGADRVSLDVGTCEYQMCMVCERRKYLPVRPGPFPAMRRIPSAASVVARSAEEFGDGQQSFRAVLISQTLFTAVRRHRLKGATFIPVAV